MLRFVKVEDNWPLSRLWECSQCGGQSKRTFRFCKTILLFCTPDWLHSHRHERGLLTGMRVHTCVHVCVFCEWYSFDSRIPYKAKEKERIHSPKGQIYCPDEQMRSLQANSISFKQLGRGRSPRRKSEYTALKGKYIVQTSKCEACRQIRSASSSSVGNVLYFVTTAT